MQAGAAISESVLVYGGRNFHKTNRDTNPSCRAEKGALARTVWTSVNSRFITPLLSQNVTQRFADGEENRLGCFPPLPKHLEIFITNLHFYLFHFFWREQLCSHLWSGREGFWKGSLFRMSCIVFGGMSPRCFFFFLIFFKKKILKFGNFTGGC